MTFESRRATELQHVAKPAKPSGGDGGGEDDEYSEPSQFFCQQQR